MTVFEQTAKISSKGRITLPKHVRDLLQSDFVRLVIEDGIVRIEAIPDLAGCLSGYAKGAPVENERAAAWEAELRERYQSD
ncbi:AbrB/MazE/SpoVT family DNA-binding domain-containing protein [uncultured Thiocystis sp.]|uniref:AbrB/MazE/SpoVT family DNA-binding domain-containing protein n=1 Tax=uncultured Thiocystis sp. TaxID=1202134 RepID=UPI0025E4869F|nr:AbrB/MazE/SpoVT family DNA-binding domain-containing protein [uncultured Thiocystis sp.]